MTILLVDGTDKQEVYEGLAPNKRTAAETIKNHVLPSLSDLKRNEFLPNDNDLE